MRKAPAPTHEAIQNLLELTDILMASGDRVAAEKAIDLVYVLCDQWILSPDSPNITYRRAAAPILVGNVAHVAVA